MSPSTARSVGRLLMVVKAMKSKAHEYFHEYLDRRSGFNKSLVQILVMRGYWCFALHRKYFSPISHRSAVGRTFMFMILGWINAHDKHKHMRFFIFFPGINAPININIKSSWRRQTRRAGDGGAGRARGYGGKRYEVRGDAREYVRDERGAAGRGWRRSVGRGEA